VTDTHFVLLPQTPWAGPAPILRDGPDIDLHRGVPVEPPTQKLRYELRVDKSVDNPVEYQPLDLHDPGNGQLLMSPKVVKCLADLGVDNVQYIPAEATYVPTGAVLPYELGNILGLVKALDVEASDCQVDEDGFVETFFSLRLNKAEIESFDLFRMYESFHTIIVSRRVREALEAAGVTGVLFFADTEWQPGML